MPDWLEGGPEPEKIAGALGGDVDGMLREFAIVRADALLPIPEHLDFEEAATLPCAGGDGLERPFRCGRFAAGPNASPARHRRRLALRLQFGLLAGATVILTSSSEEKMARARALGAHHTVNYRTEPDWEKRVLEITGGRGVDLTLEVGGAGTLARTLRATRLGGEVSLIGVLSEGDVKIFPILHRSITVHGIYVGSREMFAAMNRAVAGHRLKPMVDRIFPFAESPAAFQYLESGGHFGKVVIRIG